MKEGIESSWNPVQRQIFRIGFIFVGLLLLTFPCDRQYLPNLAQICSSIAVPLADWTAKYLLRLRPDYIQEIANDSTLLYVQLLNMLFLAAIGGSIWGLRSRNRSGYPLLHDALRIGVRYYLVAAMLTYGFAKIFKSQFYVPEPNTLYTQLGDVPRDLLFWSTMGVSRGYSIFAGVLEVVVGILLLWRRTTLLGALLGLAVMGNVLALNLSFDISVKVFSAFLCLLCVLLIAPATNQTYQFLVGNPTTVVHKWLPPWESLRRWRFYLLVKTILICLLFFEALGPYFKNSNFNDDIAPRPRFHGAYEVNTFVQNGDSLSPDIRNARRWRRAFVHRKSFFVIQTMDDQMRDYVLQWDSMQQRITFLDPATADFGQFEYESFGDSILHLHGFMNRDTLDLQMRSLKWQRLPLVEGEFHWTSDQP